MSKEKEYSDGAKDSIELEDTFVVEDDFSYFCMYDDLMGVVSSRNIELPAIADSCYVDNIEDYLPLKH